MKNISFIIHRGGRGKRGSGFLETPLRGKEGKITKLLKLIFWSHPKERKQKWKDKKILILTFCHTLKVKQTKTIMFFVTGFL
jgi:hypothetical protein